MASSHLICSGFSGHVHIILHLIGLLGPNGHRSKISASSEILLEHQFMLPSMVSLKTRQVDAGIDSNSNAPHSRHPSIISWKRRHLASTDVCPMVGGKCTSCLACVRRDCNQLRIHKSRIYMNIGGWDEYLAIFWVISCRMLSTRLCASAW